MADESLIGIGYQSGWDMLKQMFADNGLKDLADVITESVKNYGAENDALILQDFRNSEAYKTRFAGNFQRVANGKNWLSEGTYLYQEQMYRETMAAHQAGDLATRDNFNKFIANDVSPNELSARFTQAYDRVQAAVNSNDKSLVDELRKMYPGVTDNELANSLLLGNEGSDYLKNKIDIATVKAAETDTGVKSVLGADYLVSQGVDRNQARAGLAKVKQQQTGMELAAQTFGQSPEEIRKQLEQENVLGQAGQGTQKLASQARAQMSTISGTNAGSLKKNRAGQI